jgi:DNA-binding transcriptional MerR regulator
MLPLQALPVAISTEHQAMETGATYTSGDLARATGQTLRTVRFYEEQGLLASSAVSDGGHRRFDESALERLRLIVDFRDLGLSLQDIRELLMLRDGCRGGADFRARLRAALPDHVAHARQKVERLRRLESELRHALASLDSPPRASSPCDCPAAVAVDGGTPRIVRVLARGGSCIHAASTGEAPSDAPVRPGRPVRDDRSVA